MLFLIRQGTSVLIAIFLFTIHFFYTHILLQPSSHRVSLTGTKSIWYIWTLGYGFHRCGLILNCLFHLPAWLLSQNLGCNPTHYPPLIHILLDTRGKRLAITTCFGLRSPLVCGLSKSPFGVVT